MTSEIKNLLEMSKSDIFSFFGTHDGDTGSVYIQIALLEKRILLLSNHLDMHKNDVITKRSLLIMISDRKRKLDYLKKKSLQGYKALMYKLASTLSHDKKRSMKYIKYADTIHIENSVA